MTSADGSASDSITLPDDVPGWRGSPVCYQDDEERCEVVSIGISDNLDFTATYDFSAQLEASLDGAGLLPTVPDPTRRRLQTPQYDFYQQRYLAIPDGVIKNPVICLKVGAAVAFDIDSANKEYPVYERNSLVNSNPDFDYGEFLDLADAIEGGATVSHFIFSFTEAGVYVFSINNVADTDLDKYLVIGVMSDAERCDNEDAFI